MAPPALKSRAAEAPAEKLPPKVFFLLFFSLSLRGGSLSKNIRGRKRSLQMAPRCLHLQLFIHFFFFLCGSAGRRGGRCEESVCLIYWTNSDIFLFYLFFLKCIYFDELNSNFSGVIHVEDDWRSCHVVPFVVHGGSKPSFSSFSFFFSLPLRHEGPRKSAPEDFGILIEGAAFQYPLQSSVASRDLVRPLLRG